MPNSKIFIIGAPRSGTTWLHKMLCAHNETSGIEAELTIFNRYIAPLYESYKEELIPNQSGKYKQGMPQLYSEEAFIEELYNLSERFYNNIPFEGKVLIDKHPHYSEHIELIDKIYPRCKFIHIHRDGREAAISWMKVSKRAGFGASSIGQAANDWKKHVLGASLAEKYGKERYLELTYSNLLNKPEEILSKAFRFCHVSCEQKGINDIVKKYAGEKNMLSSPDQTIDYKKRKEVDYIWKREMSLKQRYIFNLIAGKELKQFGYTNNDQWVGSGIQKARMKLFFRLKSIQSRFKKAYLALFK